MRVLHVIPSLSPLRGGTTEAVLGMGKALIQQGVDVEIVATNDHGEGTLDWPLRERMVHGGVPVRVFPRWSPSIQALREFQYSRELGQWLRENIGHYDILHAHVLFSYVPTYGMSLARKREIPYINSPGGLLCQWSMQQQATKKWLFWRLIEKLNLSAVKAMHFTSDLEKEESTPWIGSQVSREVIPLGCVASSYEEAKSIPWKKQFALPLNAPCFLFLGRIHPKKGLDLLLSSLSKLSGENWVLAVAGKGDPKYVASLQLLARQLGIEHKIRWVPFVEGEQKAGLLHAADFFVLTSYSENFGITVIEALCSGVPVIISNSVALAPEVAKYKFGYVTEITAEQITTKLKEALHSMESWREKRGEISRKAKTIWDWSVIAQKLVAVYSRMLNGNLQKV
jgi:glycosyltransferase involved in cell wall biosynthesis